MPQEAQTVHEHRNDRVLTRRGDGDGDAFPPSALENDPSQAEAAK